MKIDIQERKNMHQKKMKMSLIMTIIFAVLTLTSIICFIIFANYKIQLLMPIIGSIVSSIFAIVTLGFLFIGYLPNKCLLNFYSELENKEDQSLTGCFKNTNRFLTLKKGLSFLVIYVDGQEYYLVDETMLNGLKDDEKYQFVLKGNYVAGVAQYE